MTKYWLFVCCAALAVTSTSAYADFWRVDSTHELRDALLKARRSAELEIIVLKPNTTYYMNGKALDVRGQVMIIGNGATIHGGAEPADSEVDGGTAPTNSPDGDQTDRTIRVRPGAAVQLYNLTIRGGQARYGLESITPARYS